MKTFFCFIELVYFFNFLIYHYILSYSVSNNDPLNQYNMQTDKQKIFNNLNTIF